MYASPTMMVAVAAMVYACVVVAVPTDRMLARERRIISGKPAAIKQWQHIAYLHFLQPSPRFKVCSAVLIHRQWALTAAHCVLDIRNSPQNLTVGIGRSRRSEIYDPLYNRTVSEIIVHPKYVELMMKYANAHKVGTQQQIKGAFDYDIALIRLSDPVPSSITVKPIEIAKPNSDLSSSDFIGRCSVAGWGSANQFAVLKNGGQQYMPSLDLKKFSLPVVTNQVCRDSYRVVNASSHVKACDVTERIICAGDTLATATGSGCMGDSGSPLICTNLRHRKVLCGLLVTGSSTCTPGANYMLLTRVSTYNAWIDKELADHGDFM